MMTNQSTKYQAGLDSVTFVIVALGLLLGNIALADGGCNLKGDIDGDCDVDYDDLVLLSQLWVTQPGSQGGRWDHSVRISFDSLLDVDYFDTMSTSMLQTMDINEPNQPIVSEVELTFAGGNFELPGGLTLEIPSGAVNEDTSFQIRLLEPKEVEPYLNIGQTEKSFIGGVEIVSEGIGFNLPVSIRLPIDPLEEPNNLPYLFYLNRDTGTLVPDLVSSETIASGFALAETNPVGKYFEVDCDKGELAIRDLTEFPPEDWVLVMAAMDKILVHSDCINNPCRCCRFRVQATDSDIVEDGLCTNVSSEGEIKYLDCPFGPTERWNFKESSIQITYTMDPDRDSILCERSLTMTVKLFDINDVPLENQAVEVTSSRPDLLAVNSDPNINNVFVLERVGEDAGRVDVLIDAGCGITRTVSIQIGCKIPNVVGRWSIIGSATWWDCNDFEDNGTYPLAAFLEIDSQNGSTFAGSISYENEYIGIDYHVIETYKEEYDGRITANNCPEMTDRCTYRVSGSTSYKETYLFLGDEDNEPYVIEGITTFSGNLINGIMTLTSLGLDTEGDTCQSSATVTLRR